jgi:SAM-dependent methyltransferase
MPLLSDYAKKKLDFFTPYISKDAQVLEIGCADGRLGAALQEKGFNRPVGLDLTPPADIIGDIRDWKRLGIRVEQFEVIVAFEVIEHVHCFSECHDILKPGGLLMCTSPVPHMDWLCRVLEPWALPRKELLPTIISSIFRKSDCSRGLRYDVSGSWPSGGYSEKRWHEREERLEHCINSPPRS